MRLHVANRATGEITELAPDLDRDIAERLDNMGTPLVWAPDGDAVYALYDDEGATSLGRFNLDGSWQTVTRGISSGVNA